MTTQSITNYTFDELELGQSISIDRTITATDLQLFAAVSGDLNPIHLDSDFAANTAFGKPIAHGIFCGALISAALAMHLPGPGAVYRAQQLKFSKPVFIDDIVTVSITVKEKVERTKLVILDCSIKNQHGKPVASGEASVIAPAEKTTVQAAQLPPISVAAKAYNNA